MGFHDFSCYSPMQARPDLELSGPSGILASAQNRSISPTSTSSNSSNSPSGSTIESVSLGRKMPKENEISHREIQKGQGLEQSPDWWTQMEGRLLR